jgi:hypothetical protein
MDAAIPEPKGRHRRFPTDMNSGFGGPVARIAFTKWAQISLYAVAINFLGEGALSLVAPANLTALVGITMPTSVSVMEIRGVYGGFFFGTGLFFLLFTRRNSWLRPGLVAQASIFGGFVLARVLSIVVGDRPNLFVSALVAGEIIGLVVALILLRGLNGATSLSTQLGAGTASQ